MGVGGGGQVEADKQLVRRETQLVRTCSKSSTTNAHWVTVASAMWLLISLF